MKSLVVILTACLGSVLGEKRFIDLTHNLGDTPVNWPFNPKFNLSLVLKQELDDGSVFVANKFQTPDHFGTHMDAYMCKGGQYIDEIPIGKLTGPGVVLDFKSQAEVDHDFRVSAQDIKDWEDVHGVIPKGAVVLFNFGWFKHWPDPKKVFSTNDVSNISTFHFPGLAKDAAKYLSETRKVNALGVDTISPEFGSFSVHINFLCENRLVILENVDNLDALPTTGFQVYIGVMKLENGGGAPMRLFATVDDDDESTEEEKLVDLSHSVGYTTVRWPMNPPFNMSLTVKRQINATMTSDLNKFQTPEHFSTHIDAPYHFCPQGKYVHQIPLEKLTGPGVVIDLKSQAAKDPDYQVSVQDVLRWESKYGRIPKGAIVMFNFGWYKHWPNAEKTFGTDDVTDTSTFHFPVVGIETARFLTENRTLNAIGVDSPSPENNGFNAPVHIKILCEHGLVILESVDNLDAIPATGSFVYIAALKLENGGGTPVRLFASVPDDGDDPGYPTAGAVTSNTFCIRLILSMVTMVLAGNPDFYG